MSGLKEKETVKQLKTRITKLAVEKDSLIKETNTLHTKITNIKKEITKLNELLEQLSKNTTGKIEVSEHFLLRYCERVLAIDLKPIKKLIETQVQPVCDILGGSGTFPLEGKYKVVIKDNTAVTIVE